MFRRRKVKATLSLLVAIMQVLSLVQPALAVTSANLKVTGQGSPLTFRILSQSVSRSDTVAKPQSLAVPAGVAVSAPREGSLQTVTVTAGPPVKGDNRSQGKDAPPAVQSVSAGEFKGDAGGQATSSAPAATLVEAPAPITVAATPRQDLKRTLKVTGNSPIHFDVQPGDPVNQTQVVRETRVVQAPVQLAPATGGSTGTPAAPAVSGGGLERSTRTPTVGGKPAQVGEATDVDAATLDADAEGDAGERAPLTARAMPPEERPAISDLTPLGGTQRTGRVERQGAGAGASGGTPDLTVDLKVTPTSVRPGEPFKLTATVKNLGNGGSQDTEVNFFMSDSTATLGKTVDADSVAALSGASSNPTYEREFTAPDRAGKYFLAACVQNVTTESSLDNNTVRIPFEVVLGKPDLVINTSLDKARIGYGEPLKVTFSVENRGDDTAAATKVRLGLSRTADCKDAKPLDAAEATIDCPELGVFDTTGESLRVVKFGRTVEPGKYFVCALVDGVAKETTLDNNAKTLELEVVRPQAPDLVAKILLSSPEVEACQNLTASLSIANAGQGDASAVKVRLVQSKTKSLASFDTLAVFTLPALTPGQSAAKKFPVTIPCETPPQNTFFGVICDQATDEEITENNRAAAVLSVLARGQPDLKASILNVSPTDLRQGESFACRVQIENIGKKRAVESRYQLYLAKEGGQSRIQIAAEGLPALGPAELVSTPAGQPIKVEIPNGQAIGAYTLLLEVAPVAEEREPQDLTANNRASSGLNVREQTRPDLAVELKLSEKKIKAGGKTTASVRVTNLGNRPAPASRLSLLLGRATGGAASLIKEIPTPVLPPGAVSEVAADVSIRGDAPLGSYQVVALVDGVTAELNLTNNRAEAAFEVFEADQPELEVSLSPTTAKTCPGAESQTLQLVTRNTGKGGSPATTGRILAGRERDLRDGTEVFSCAIPALASGASAPGPCHLKFLDNAEPGLYYIAFAADLVAGEKDKSNNRAIATVEVCDRGVPDLAVQLTLSKNTILVNETVEGQVQIDNLGTSAAAASKATLFLHTSTTLVSGQGTVLTRLDVPALDVRKGTGKVSFKIKLDPKTKPATYFVHAVVDSVQRELNIANNRAFRSLEVSEPAPPDLVAKLILLPTEQRAGLKVKATMRISNAGPSAAAATSVELVFASNEALSDAISLHKATLQALGPGGFQEKEVEFSVPPGTAPGVRQVAVRVTAVPGEVKLTNNQDRKPIYVTAPPNPDVAGTITLDPINVLQGGKVRGTAKIVNIARETAAPATKFSLKVSRDSNGTDAKDAVSGADVPALKAGESIECPVQIVTEPNQAPGTYFVHLNVDAVPKEDSLANNRDVASFLVEAAPPPDLLATLKLDRSKAYPGDAIQARMTVKNIGQGVAAASVGRLVMASQGDLSDGKPLLSEPVKVPVLGAGEAREFSQTFKLDAGAAANSYTVAWVVDRVARELELTNNTDTKPLAIEPHARADLVATVTSLSPSPIGKGEGLTAILAIANAGSTASSATKARLLASVTGDFSDAVVVESDVDVPALDAGFTAGAQRTYQLAVVPKDLALLHLKLDATPVKEEDRTENNSDTAHVKYELHEYDLKCEFVGEPQKKDAKLSATVRVSNGGPFLSPELPLTVYMSPAGLPGTGASEMANLATPVAGEQSVAQQAVPKLKPGESREYPVTIENYASFRSLVARVATGELDTNHNNDHDGRRIPGAARIAVTPSPIALLDGQCLGIREVEVKVCNLGETPLLVSKIAKETNGEWWQLSRDRMDPIAPGACDALKVTLVGTALPSAGAADALVITSNDPDKGSHKVPVTGKSSGEAPAPKPDEQVSAQPAEVEVVAGTCRDISAMGVSLKYTSGGKDVRLDAYVDSSWTAKSGSVEKNTRYCAPAQPGDDTITIENKGCHGGAIKVALKVKVKAAPPAASPSPSPSPAPTVKPTPAPSPSPSAQPGGCADKLTVKGRVRDTNGGPAHGFRLRAVLVKGSGEELPCEEVTIDREKDGGYTSSLAAAGKICPGDKVKFKVVSPEGSESICEPSEMTLGAGQTDLAVDLLAGGTSIEYDLPCAGAHAITVPVLIEDAETPGKFRSPNAFDLWKKLHFSAIVRSSYLEVQQRMVFDAAVPLPVDALASEKGNNGVGNGLDPQPPGNPPVNDGAGTGPGNPGNKGGAEPKAGAGDNFQPLNLKTFLLQPGEAYIVVVNCAVKAKLIGRPAPGSAKIKLRKGLNLVGFPSAIVGKRDVRDLCRHTRSKVALRLGGEQAPFEKAEPTPTSRSFKLEPGRGYIVNCDEDQEVDMGGLENKDE